MKMTIRKALLFCVLLLTVLALGCRNQKEKKMEFYGMGVGFYESGDYVKARLELKNAIQMDPEFEKAQYMLGLVELREKNFAGAYRAFSKAAKLSPGDPKPQIQLGKLLLAAKAPEKAMAKATLVLHADPDNQEALLLKASVLLAQREGSQALHVLDGLIKKGVNTPELYFLLSKAQIEKRDLKEAQAMLERGVETNPGSVRLLSALAKFYVGIGEKKKAIDTMKKVMNLEPNNSAHMFTLAAICWDAGQETEAKALFARIISAGPRDEARRVAVARFYLSRKQIDDAEKEIKAGIQVLGKSFRLRFLLSDVYVSQGKVGAALNVLKKILLLEKNSPPEVIQAKNRIARLYLAKRDLEAAEKTVDQVLVQDRSNLDAHFTEGQIFLFKGEGAKAVAAFRIVVNQKPRFLGGYLGLADAFELNNDLDLAEDTLRQALKINPESAQVHRALAHFYERKKDLKNAEVQLRKALEDVPNNEVLRAELGDVLLALKDFDGADQEYQGVIDGAGKSKQMIALGYIKLRNLYMAQGKMEKATHVIEEGYAKSGRSATMMAALVQTYTAQKRFALAFKTCEDWLGKNPNKAFGYNLLGWIHETQKAYSQAETAYNRAIDLRPAWSKPRENLARLYLAQGKRPEAIKVLETALQYNPKDSSPFFSLAMLYEQTGEYDKAIQCYERVLSGHPNLWQAANDLAFLKCLQAKKPAQLNEALGLARRAHALSPDEPDVLDTLGWIYYKKGDMAKALGLIRRAVSGAPQDPVHNFHLGMVLYEDGRWSEARKSLARALASKERFPGREKAVSTLAKLRSQG